MSTARRGSRHKVDGPQCRNWHQRCYDSYGSFIAHPVQDMKVLVKTTSPRYATTRRIHAHTFAGGRESYSSGSYHGKVAFGRMIHQRSGMPVVTTEEE